jgi:chemosensory pili system protein ChpC
MSEENLVVRSQLIPLEGLRLVLPNTAIAEIVSFKKFDVPENEVARWILGTIDWRELRIPLISFEMASGQLDKQPTVNKNTRIVVLNTVTGSEQLHFYGLVVQGIPRLIALDHSNTHDAPDQLELNPFELRKVLVDGNIATIPDQEAIENSLSESGMSVDNIASSTLSAD